MPLFQVSDSKVTEDGQYPGQPLGKQSFVSDGKLRGFEPRTF